MSQATSERRERRERGGFKNTSSVSLYSLSNFPKFSVVGTIIWGDKGLCQFSYIAQADGRDRKNVKDVACESFLSGAKENS